jgi:FMN phosphatase YigB (HAD superfamily)
MVEVSKEVEKQKAQDIDFCIMSYDVRVEKPYPEIFNAAISTLSSLLHSEGNSYESKDWDLLYVGDEVVKDAKGAVQAGWDAVLVDRGAEVDAAYEGDAPGIEGVIDVEGKKVPVLKGFEALGTYGGHELLEIH